MNKRKRILIASLALIAVTAASTLAYFTSQPTIGNTGVGNTLQLDITNGQVSITAQPGGSASISNWSYDVARNSNTSYSGFTPAQIATYENTNRSIDMIGLGAAGSLPASNSSNVTASLYSTANVNGYTRWNIGAPVIGAITNARPGDAFVMGQAAAYGGSTTNTGLTITNNSNLTVKVQITANSDANDTFAALLNGGWKFYVGKKDGTFAEATDKTSLDSALSTALSGQTWGPNSTIALDIRLELPLTTDNTKQTKQTLSGGVSNIDLSKLFTITATQENNPGWNESGN